MSRERNPKDIAGSAKAPLHLIPGPACYHASLALGDGGRKYGFFNWRETPIEASSYLAACERHLKSWQDGEEVAQDSGVSHLGHALATLMILVDAMACGTLIDDRPKPGATPKLLTSK